MTKKQNNKHFFYIPVFSCMCDNITILFPLSLCTLLCSVRMIREKNGTQHQEQQQLVSHQVHLQPRSYYFTLT